MPYDEGLAMRVRGVLEGQSGLTEKKMFGGLAFMVHGSMVCGVVRDDLMVRVGPDNHEEALSRPHARPMDFTGRAMRGMVYVGSGGCSEPRDLRGWIGLGLGYARSLPPKTAKRAPASKQ